MTPALIFAIIQELPALFALVAQIPSLKGNPQAIVDAVSAFLINAIPDSIAPMLVPEIKQVIQTAVAIYDKFSPILKAHAAPVTGALSPGLQAALEKVGTISAASAPPTFGMALGNPMPAK